MGLILSGTFQVRSRLSAKALRLYAEQGILEPVHVDPANRYRYYSEEQLLDARLINMLRAIEMPLASIRAVLSAEGAERAQLIDEYWKRREAQHWGQHNLAAYVISVVSANKETTMTVQTRTVTETTYLTEVKRVSPPEIPAFIQGSGDRLAEQAGRFGGWAGPLTTIFETPVNDDTDGDVRNAVPVRAGVTAADVEPPTEVLVEPAGNEAYRASPRRKSNTRRSCRPTTRSTRGSPNTNSHRAWRPAKSTSPTSWPPDPTTKSATSPSHTT